MIIKLNRGDSFNFSIVPFSYYTKESLYKLKPDDVVYFALMNPHQPFEEAFLIKGYTFEDQNTKTGEIEIKITPNDTRELKPGVYYYTIKLQRGGTLDVINDLDEPDEVCTIVERTKFIVNE